MPLRLRTRGSPGPAGPGGRSPGHRSGLRACRPCAVRGVSTPYARVALAESESRSWHFGARRTLAESPNLTLETRAAACRLASHTWPDAARLGLMVGVPIRTFDDGQARFQQRRCTDPSRTPAPAAHDRHPHCPCPGKAGELLRDDRTPSLDLKSADAFDRLLAASVHHPIATGPTPDHRPGCRAGAVGRSPSCDRDMDPISQGALGALVPQVVSRREKLRAFAVLGCLAGMAPDLDVFIDSSTDPLLFLEFHRQFTHALLFIPIGAALVALPLQPVVRRTLRPRETYLACLLGYATHGLLDACTSYGTQLLWPFSEHRVAWNNVSVVDSLFTLPLLGLVSLAAVRRRRAFAVAGLSWAVCYLALGAVQHQRARGGRRATGGGAGASAAPPLGEGRLREPAGLEGGVRARRAFPRRRDQSRHGRDGLPWRQHRSARRARRLPVARPRQQAGPRRGAVPTVLGTGTSRSTRAGRTASSTCATRWCPTPSTRCGESISIRGPRPIGMFATSRTGRRAPISAACTGDC